MAKGNNEYYKELAQSHIPRSDMEILNGAQIDLLSGSSGKMYNRIYDIERQYWQYISEGDVERMRDLFHANFADAVKEGGSLTYDKLKDCEYLCAFSILLSARAAISGGASIQTVYALQYALTQRISELFKARDYYNLSYEAIIIFTSLVQRHRQSDIKDKKVAEIMAYIKNNLGSRLTIQELARHFHMNSDYLSRKFMAEAGVSVKSYIQKIRVDTACDLLTYSDLALSDIAAITGFSSQSYFGEVFSKITGTTPAAFRIQKKILTAFP